MELQLNKFSIVYTDYALRLSEMLAQSITALSRDKFTNLKITIETCLFHLHVGDIYLFNRFGDMIRSKIQENAVSLLSSKLVGKFDLSISDQSKYFIDIGDLYNKRQIQFSQFELRGDFIPYGKINKYLDVINDIDQLVKVHNTDSNYSIINDSIHNLCYGITLFIDEEFTELRKYTK